MNEGEERSFEFMNGDIELAWFILQDLIRFPLLTIDHTISNNDAR